LIPTATRTAATRYCTSVTPEQPSSSSKKPATAAPHRVLPPPTVGDGTRNTLLAVGNRDDNKHSIHLLFARHRIGRCVASVTVAALKTKDVLHLITTLPMVDMLCAAERARTHRWGASDTGTPSSHGRFRRPGPFDLCVFVNSGNGVNRDRCASRGAPLAPGQTRRSDWAS
jgi:hypothetical protein